MARTIALPTEENSHNIALAGNHMKPKCVNAVERRPVEEYHLEAPKNGSETLFRKLEMDTEQTVIKKWFWRRHATPKVRQNRSTALTHTIATPT